MCVDGTLAEHVHGKGGLSGLTLEKVKEMVSTFLMKRHSIKSVEPSHGEDHADWYKFADRSQFPTTNQAEEEPLFVSVYKKLLDEAPPQTINIVALGPLTNLAALQRLAPSSFARVKEVFIMGGSFFQSGNITPVSEFNIYTDPHAASLVLSNPLSIPMTLVPLNVTEKVRLRQSAATQLIVEMKGEKRGLLPDFVGAFVKPYFDSMVDQIYIGSEATLAMHDP